MSSKQSNKQSSKQSKQAKQIGEDIWKNQTVKINSELFTLTYGSIVAQICREEFYDYQKVNDILFNMGRNIGVRLIEEFLSKSNLERCTSLKETSEIITKIGFKMFLNIVPNISYWSPDGRTFQITLIENPLSDFVELPDDIDDVEYDYDNENNNDNENRITNGLEDLSISGNGNGNGNEDSNNNKNRKGNARKDLWYSNILCGVLKGALEMVQLDCQVWFISDILRGDATTDIRVKLVQVLKDEIPDGDE
jgi:hypothetical protein